MKLLAVFDVSAFIWDVNHFNENKTHYYNLMEVLPNLCVKIICNNIPVLFRDELKDEIFYNYPYGLIPHDYFDFETLTLRFLTKIIMVDYPSVVNTQLTISPNLIKEFYTDNTQREVKYLMTYLFSDNESIPRFLTFSIFWNEERNLTLSYREPKEILTYKCDNIDNHESIICSLKKIFDHNPKHNKYKSSTIKYYGKVISPISCYNERLKDKTEAQKLLDMAVLFKGDFFNFDKNNDTFVIFVHTVDNIYHGFDIKPSLEDIILINEELKNE